MLQTPTSSEEEPTTSKSRLSHLQSSTDVSSDIPQGRFSPFPPSPPMSPTSPSSTTAETWLSSEKASANIRPILPGPNDPTPTVISWDTVKNYISVGLLDRFKRNPFDRVRYKAWCRNIISQYGSMTAYMCAERLKWTPISAATPTTGPVFAFKGPHFFADPADCVILFNDWPYGCFESGIIHLIVWSKIRIPTDSATGLPTAESAARIEDFVKRTFADRLGAAGVETAEEDVTWFKNPPSLQTVAGLEHIHILLRNPPQALLEEWTGESGPVPHPGFEAHDLLGVST